VTFFSLPKPPETKKKKGGSKQAVCITEDHVVEEMRIHQDQRKAEREQNKRTGRKSEDWKKREEQPDSEGQIPL
jgi:hypothetical protein